MQRKVINVGFFCIYTAVSILIFQINLHLQVFGVDKNMRKIRKQNKLNKIEIEMFKKNV